MRKAMKYVEKMKKSGLGVVNDALYWINGDAKLKASQRQKLRKFIGWLEKLPERLEKEYGFKDRIYINSSYYVNGGNEQIFTIDGYTLKDIYEDKNIFSIKVIVNDLDENDDVYTDHWEGFKKWLKELDINNLDRYLDDYFRPIEISRDDENIWVSHTVSIFGVQGLINFLYDENENVNKKGWFFNDYLSYTNYPDKFLGVHHSGNKDYFFWEPEHTNRLLTLEVWYSDDKSTRVVNHEWSNTTFKVDGNVDDEHSLWIFRWDENKKEWSPFTKNEFN